MRSSAPLKALLALSAAFVSAQDCDDADATITIVAAAEATIDCEVIEGTILIEDGVDPIIDISGPQQVQTLMVRDAGTLQRLSSSSINAIHGTWNMSELNSLSFLSFSSLRTVGTINWEHLGVLDSFDFGDGLEEAETVIISDTFIRSLNGLSLTTVDVLDLNNNFNLDSWTSQLTNVTERLSLTENGQTLFAAEFPDLVWAANIEARRTLSISVPSLLRVNESLRLDENDSMRNFTAANLTQVDNLSFRNNSMLSEIDMPALEQVSEFAIINNPALKVIDGFPNLERVNGALHLGGDFTEVELPSLESVRGQATITSTEDISDSCVRFDEMIEQNDIRGDDSECDPLNENANDEDDDGSGGDGGDDDDDDDGGAAGNLSVNLYAAVGVALVGSLALGAF